MIEDTNKLRMKSSVLKQLLHPNKARTHRKFVNKRMLSLVFILTGLLALWYAQQMKEKPVYVIILVVVLILCFAWTKMYQILYDLKMISFFNKKCDSELFFSSYKKYPAIAFIIPSYQEPFRVAKMTIDSVLRAPYEGKKEIIIVDNSRNTLSEDFAKLRNYVEILNAAHPAENITAKFIHNRQTSTLKPGNLDLAEQFVEDGEFVVILDVDSTLPSKKDLLERAVTEFLLDDKLGFLQFSMKATNSHFNNLTQSVALSQDLHRMRLTSRSSGGYKIFEGHNGMWRKAVLKKVGAWTDYYKGNIMITEDILKSALVYDQGYHGRTINIATGEWVPNSLQALESMWMRWTYGTSQVLFKYPKKLYSKTVSSVEKFDIAYHTLHSFSQGFIFPLAILLQLFTPGLVTNSFIFLMYLLPQLVGTTAVCLSPAHKANISTTEKLKCLYGGFFLVDTFIMSTQLKSSINFLLGVPQGWKVTGKGIDNSNTWNDLLLSKSFHLIMASIALISCGYSWLIHYNMHPSAVIHLVLLGFMSINLLLCILTFGKMGRKEYNDIRSATIDGEDLDDYVRLVPLRSPSRRVLTLETEPVAKV